MNHERLKSYELMLDFAKKLPDMLKHLPRGNSYLEDQIKRALSSAILNLSEGNGRWGIKERNRFFDILGIVSRDIFCNRYICSL